MADKDNGYESAFSASTQHKVGEDMSALLDYAADLGKTTGREAAIAQVSKYPTWGDELDHLRKAPAGEQWEEGQEREYQLVLEEFRLADSFLAAARPIGRIERDTVFYWYRQGVTKGISEVLEARYKRVR